MGFTSAVTFSQLVDEIKVEARIKGANNLDITIQAIVNELLLAHSETERYSALLVRGAPLALVAGQSDYQLPDDFANIRTVYWWRQGQPVMARTLRNKNDFIEESRDGSEPKWYEIAGDLITLWPSSGILITDSCTIDYWQLPQALVNDTDLFPIPKLLPVIKREAIARIHVLNKDFNGAGYMQPSSEKVDEAEQTTEDNSDAS